MRDEWVLLVFWMVPNIAVAALAWAVTEPPKNRGWEATKGFFGMAAAVVLFGVPHGFFWLFVIMAPFAFAYDRVDRHFGGEGIREFDP